MKNFYTNTGKPTCFFLFLLWSFLLLSSLGCGSMPWQIQTVVTYQSVGVMMEEAKISVETMCADGTLNTEDCAEATATYNKAVTVYKAMGVAIDSAIDTGSDLEYRSLALTLSKLLEILNQFLVNQ